MATVRDDIEMRTARSPLSRGELLVIVAFWTFVAILSSANRMMDPRIGPLLPVLPSAPIALAFTQAYLWALLTPVVFWLSSKVTIDRHKWLPRALLILGAGLVIAICVDSALALVRHSLYAVRAGSRPPPSVWFMIQHFWFIDDLTVFLAILAAGFARESFMREQHRHAEAAELKAQLAEAHLAALRTQLNPHFLFNTLNAVSAMVERDPAGVRRMVARLSELLRQTLEGASSPYVSLGQELSFIERYLEIMRIRFPDELQIETRVDANVVHAIVPNLVLQPLVENAIKHGGIETSGAGAITIVARKDGETLVLTVADNGPGPNGSTVRGAGTGLTNTRARLAGLYGVNQSVTLRPGEHGGTIAEIVMPYVTRTDR